MYLSRGQDLNAFATADEQLTLVYSDSARGENGVKGRVLYVGIRGDQTKIECFVYRETGGDFACVSGDDVLARRHRRQRHGDAGRRRPDGDLRPEQAPRAQHGAREQGRRLGRTRRHARGRGLRRQDRVPGRWRRLRQSRAHRASGQQGDALRPSAAVRGRGRCRDARSRPARSSAMSGRRASPRARDCISSSTRTGSRSIRSPRPAALRPGMRPSTRSPTASSASKAAAVPGRRTRSPRRPASASSSTPPGCRMMNTYRPDLAEPALHRTASRPALRPDDLARDGAQPRARGRSLSEGARPGRHRRAACISATSSAWRGPAACWRLRAMRRSSACSALA